VNNRPEKHSLTLNGHRTSVSLEPEFWIAFRRIAAKNKRPINALAADIDADRGDLGLASAIRLHVLRDLQRGESPESSEITGV
jgi:predicted DNA-binding ribbon-helix-helix protein